MEKGLRDTRFAELDAAIIRQGGTVKAPVEPTPESLQRAENTCKWCAKPFTPNPRNHTKRIQMFCNARCRWWYWDSQNPRKKQSKLNQEN